MPTLSPGTWRGLRATSTENHIFNILAFDQRGNYIKMLPPETSYASAAQIKREVAAGLARAASAVLLDPVYGLDAALYMTGRCGLLMALEKTGYSGDATDRHLEFIPAWTVEKIKHMGADGVKLLVYYNPTASNLAEEIENQVRAVSAACRAVDLPLFVEPLLYSLDSAIETKSAAFAAQRPHLSAETARRLGACGADVLKLEFPVDVQHTPDPQEWAAACAAVSAAAAVPWALLSAGVAFDTFATQVEIACKNGASGFIGGRAIWQECVTLSSDHRNEFLAQIAAPRLQALAEIAHRYARPWTDFYSAPSGNATWYETYPSP